MFGEQLEEFTLCDEARWYSLTSLRYKLNATAVFDYFRRHDIEPILIKGLAVSRFYPHGESRYSADVDIAVRASDFSLAEKIICEPECPKVGIDLHRELRHLDTVPWDKLFANSERLVWESGDIRVLSPEDNLRVTVTHWLNDGGANKERLWDIYYAVARRPPSFSWAKCLDVVEAHRRGWIITAIALAHKYLNLDVSNLPFANEVLAPPEWICQTVEDEWKSDVQLLPLHFCLYQPTVLFKQIRKRIPPNPIQATIEMEGDLINGNRYAYQLGDFFWRMAPSFKRVTAALFRK